MLDITPPAVNNEAMTAGSLTEIVDDYIVRFRPSAERELQYFRTLRTDEDAVSRAALAQLPSGKRHPHQYRVPRTALEESRRRLLERRSDLKASRSFEDLFGLVESLIGPISRIGALTVYDTALRVGARFRLEPSVIYLHAGTRIGAQKLGLDVTRGYLDQRELPRALRRLTARETEDLLCIYKDGLSSADGCVPSRVGARAVRSRCDVAIA